mgnify:CR=1 FL=1
MTPLFNDNQWRYLYRLHCLGYTYQELADWLGISHGTVQYNFYRLGLKSYSGEREPLAKFTNEFLALGGETNARPESN